ncbi:hypothetical protein KEH51_00110 [[Brevibacterium] frigoritolerans]|uniref:Uncharacterized protein n=1 Tax=Peribacillus frigoritolerans TaxID=450367 RepID=A0A941J9G8_9BACI|nr:hypothetical protein [Peribacillus frigoritolerans]
MIHFLLNLITDMGKEIFVAVATSLILSMFQETEKEPLILPRWQWFFF